MPIVLIIAGVVFLVSGTRGTASTLLSLLRGDLTGKDSYLYWAVAILAIGALGYSDTLKPFSRAMTALVVIVLFLKNGGVFDKFNQEFFSKDTAISGNPPKIGASGTSTQNVGGQTSISSGGVGDTTAAVTDLLFS